MRSTPPRTSAPTSPPRAISITCSTSSKSSGIEKGDILHTAESLFHDHRPANDQGLHNCWIFRRFDKEGFGATMNPGVMPTYDFRFTSMAELAAAHRAELAA